MQRLNLVQRTNVGVVAELAMPKATEAATPFAGYAAVKEPCLRIGIRVN